MFCNPVNSDQKTEYSPACVGYVSAISGCAIMLIIFSLGVILGGISLGSPATIQLPYPVPQVITGCCTIFWFVSIGAGGRYIYVHRKKAEFLDKPDKLVQHHVEPKKPPQNNPFPFPNPTNAEPTEKKTSFRTSSESSEEENVLPPPIKSEADSKSSQVKIKNMNLELPLVPILESEEFQEKINMQDLNFYSRYKGPVGVILSAAKALKMTEDEQRKLKEFVDGIFYFGEQSKSHLLEEDVVLKDKGGSVRGAVRLLILKFSHLFKLIAKAENSNELLQKFLLELSQVPGDNGEAIICRGGIGKKLFDWELSLEMSEIFPQKTIDKSEEVKYLCNALEYLRSLIIIDVVDQMIADQAGLDIYFPPDSYSRYDSEESSRREKVLISLETNLHNLVKSEWNKSISPDLKKFEEIFPRKKGKEGEEESDEAYFYRLQKLGQVPFNILLTNSHDNNKRNNFINSLCDSVPPNIRQKLPKAIDEANETYWDVGEEEFRSEYGNSFHDYYYTTNNFVQGVYLRLQDSSWNAVNGWAKNYVWERTQAVEPYAVEHYFQENGALSLKGVSYLIDCLTKEGLFSLDLFLEPKPSKSK